MIDEFMDLMGRKSDRLTALACIESIGPVSIAGVRSMPE